MSIVFLRVFGDNFLGTFSTLDNGQYGACISTNFNDIYDQQVRGLGRDP